MAVLAVIALLGYLAKAQILSRLSKLIEKEVLDALFVIKEAEEHKAKPSDETSEDGLNH